MNVSIKSIFVLSLFFCGCSFLDEPPPYPNVGTNDMGRIDSGTSRSRDFGQRSPDAFVPQRPPSRPRDAMVDAAPDSGPDASINDAGLIRDASAPAAADLGLRTCQERCIREEDCNNDSTCADSLCVPVVCAVPGLCWARLSGWNVNCGENQRCPDGFGCVAIGAAGLCAPFFMVNANGDDNCPNGQGPTEQRRFDQSLITVCGYANAACRNQVCSLGCTQDADCQDPRRPICDLDSGRCRCSETSCAEDGSMSVCGLDGACLCTLDDDCTALGLDRCIEGQCGCSSVDACPDTREHVSTEVVCQPPR